MVVKKINTLSAVKIFALLSAITGLFLGLTFAMLSIFGFSVETETGSVPIDKTLGLLSIIFFPLMYGIMGAVSGCVIAFFYNCIASRMGGIEFEVE